MSQEQRNAGHGVVIDRLAKNCSQRVEVGIGEAVCVRIARPENLWMARHRPSRQAARLPRPNLPPVLAGRLKRGDEHSERLHATGEV